MDKAARAALLTAKGMDNRSENIADYVADLLRQGRAKEVTDDLMAQADPQRLHQHYTSGNTGMHLPMDQASRMARAAQMGYTNKEYRGVADSYDRAAPRKIYDGEGGNRIGFWTSNNPYVASTYAHPLHGSVYPFLAKEPQGGFPEVDVMGGKYFQIPTDSTVNKNGKNIPLTEYANHLDDDYSSDEVARGAAQQGDSGIKFKNMKDPGGYDHFDEGPYDPNMHEARKASDITARIDTSGIRSQFARFDPRLEHLAHLSASTGGAMDFARHVEAVHRAGGQIAPSKYLPNVPRQVHAGGGKVAFMQGNHPDVPDVVYHGTNQDIQSFDPEAKRSYDIDPRNPDSTNTGWFGKGHYFTPRPKIASHYADEAARRHSNNEGAQVYPVHLSMKNPFVVNMKDADSGATTLDKALNNAGVPMHPRGYRMPSEQTAALTAMGHDGVIAKREGKTEEIVAFHPQQIKSAIGNQGTFDPNDPDITKAGGGRIHANGGGTMDLRSRAANVVSGLQQKRGNVDELLSMLAKGKVKAAELINAGRPFGHSVSKEELAEHFRNAVPQVSVERLGGMDSNQHTRFDDYFLPGAKNYREHLLTLQNREGNAPFVYPWHWGDRKNILAHVRMADRDNGETLHVGEVQSDWGQQARQRGFYDPSMPFRVYNKETQETKKLAKNQFEARDEAIKSGSGYAVEPSINYHPPVGPYVGDTQQWTDLALKHILTEAAKNGHKRIVFSPGEHSADMYKQRWKVDSLRLHRNPEGSDTLGTLAPYDKDGFLTASGFTPVKDEKDLADQIGEEHAAKLLASPLKSLPRSNTVVDQWQQGDPAPEPTHTLSEPDMHLGGQGMIKYYKRNVNAGVLKLLRQHDPSIQPESYDLPSDPEAGNREGYKGFAVPMTDTARQSILDNGFQAFKAGGTVDEPITAYHSSPHDFDQFDVSKLGTGEGNQSYGPGLYFAENPKVSDRGGQYWNQFMNRGKTTPEKQAAFALKVAGWDRDKAADSLQKNLEYHADRAIPGKYGNGPVDEEGNRLLAQETQEAIDHVRSGKILGPRTYKVKLHVKPHELIDWDEPLSEQHPNIKAVLGSSHETAGSKLSRVNRNPNYRGDILGKDTATLQELYDHFLSKGIKGIRYNDAGSRHGFNGDGTKNYVMFHHDPVQIVDKYEYGGTVDKAGGGAMGEGSDIQRSRVQELIDKHGGDDQAAKEYLRTSLPSIPASSQDFWQRTLDNFDYLKNPKPVQQVAAPVAQENSQLENPEYSTGHTAPHPEEGAMMHDLHAVFPDIATHGRQYYGTGERYDHESFGPISRVNGRPSASVHIYRAVHKDVENPKINAGDWVTTSPSYAKEHGEANLGNKYKILKKTVRADELATNGDSIHEWGYWPKTDKASGGTVDRALALTRRFTKDGNGATLALKTKGK
jgi:hypothetical protein